ncbi:MAG: hypothetical protein OZSIB_2077 [Candidatus Ozemobacter sibiricus]|jgi:hypothetical protein|uniref:Uncharacterized protein n=1 Tax=Candidatus Ozemobacter sibiricus TaxID=2268124 RepID=A0A367ZSU8_9BACT|nr:MAG: hypothetical protein OZSIB_2077 [Candidatus Ozemobacter sibiricus]
MNRMHRLLFVVLVGWWVALPGQALDLSAYQGFMKGAGRNRSPASPSPPSAPPSVAPVAPLPGPERLPPSRPLVDDADASYRGGRVMTLYDANTGRGAFSLPQDTRIPEGLRPLLNDRKYPRQGISLSGTSGAMLVPSPGVLEPGKSAVAVHVLPFDLYNVNDVRYTDQDYFDTSFKLSYGAFEGFEIGVDKTFANQDRYDIAEPVYLNAKYQVPGNITFGGSFCTDSQSGYHSVWVGAGVPVAWAAVGTNFGAGTYHFFYSGAQKLKRAKFGGYNYKYDRAEGYADPIFFLIGGAIPVSNSLHFLYDFNGDRFSLGFRFNYQRVLHLDAAYVSDGDYERLPGAIAAKRLRNFLFGGSIVW